MISIFDVYFDELEKIANLAVQQAPGGQAGEMVPDESSPAHGVVASNVQQLDPRRAVGIPVMQPPPGYVYAPDLAAFVPNEQDPGWVPEQAVPQAMNNQQWYQQGQQDDQAQIAQQQVDGIAAQDAEASAQQAQQDQQMSAMQQIEGQKAQQKAMGEAAKAGYGEAASSPVSTGRGTKKKSSSKAKEPGKGVTIKIGK